VTSSPPSWLLRCAALLCLLPVGLAAPLLAQSQDDDEVPPPAPGASAPAPAASVPAPAASAPDAAASAPETAASAPPAAASAPVAAASAPMVPASAPMAAASAPAAAARADQAAASAPEQAASAVAAAVAAGASEPVPILPRVVIRSGRKPVQGTLGSVTTLSGREAALVPGAGLDSIKALQTLPGVASDGEGSSEPVVRGSRPGDNAYYIDSLPVGYMFHLGGALSVLPGELVQSFDLHSAAFGPQFTDVIGAVVDVTTRRPRSDRFGGKLDASLLAGGVVLEGPLGEQQSFFLAGRRSYWDLFVDEIEDDNGRIYNLPRYRDYQFKFLRQLANGHQLTVNVNGATDHVDYRVPEGTELANKQPTLVGEGRRDISYGTQALQWEHDLGGRGSHRLSVGRTGERVGNLSGTAVDAGLRSERLFVREQLRLDLGPRHELWLGGSLERRRLDLAVNLLTSRCTEFEPECDISSGERVVVRDRLNLDQADLYVRDRWAFRPRWALTTGLRHSRDRYLGQRRTEPRLGLEWKASEATLFTAAWGRHHQQPDGLQILPALGNPRLDPLRARHAMLGMHQALDGGWSWRVEVYDKRLRGLVVSDPGLNYRNGGSGRAYGAELLLRKEQDERGLSGWLSLSWSRSVRRNDLTGQEFGFDHDQPLIASLVALWRFNERWTFGARWNYHTGELETPIIGSRVDEDGRIRPVYGVLNSERLPAYHRLDLRADRRFSERLSGYMELLNAYNRNNITGYSYNEDYSVREPSGGWPLLFTVGVQSSF
jgi:outer membrane receptor protein involved in Fe transport